VFQMNSELNPLTETKVVNPSLYRRRMHNGLSLQVEFTS
jgi:hypothetical protein